MLSTVHTIGRNKKNSGETWWNLKKLNVKEKGGRYIRNDDDLFGEWTFKPYQLPRLPPFNL
jgi:hypothetical protein